MRWIGSFLVAVVVGLSLTPGREATAMDGSCKERGFVTAPWQPNGLNFEQCKARNQQKDGDNVFDQQGLVWWDVRG